MSDARRIAADILLRIERDRAYSSLSLNAALKNNTLPQRDAALVTALVYGVVERKITLDYNISLYLKSPLKKLHPTVLVILRLGAYQLLFADKIPARAAVNESVALAKNAGVAFAAGLINAVLRKIAANGLVLPAAEDAVRYLSVKYSCPEALILHFTKHYGAEKTEAHLSACMQPRPLFIRMNPLRCTEQSLYEALRQEGAELQPAGFDGAYILGGAGDVTSLTAFRNGFFHVQDLSSQYAALLVGAKPGDKVVDCCAAPGGKSFTIAETMRGEGTVYACDLYEHKTALIESGARRLGIGNIKTVCEDAALLYRRGIAADAVLCDVPCSGFGVIGRKPEIRYKELSFTEALPELQYSVLCSGAAMVKPGGTLVYSTCTLNPAENEDVCSRFLKERPGFAPWRESDGAYYRNIFASPTGGDGFFAARFKRISE